MSYCQGCADRDKDIADREATLASLERRAASLDVHLWHSVMGIALQGDFQRMTMECAQGNARDRDAAESRLAAVRALHCGSREKGSELSFCQHCGHLWPCKTIAVLGDGNG